MNSRKILVCISPYVPFDGIDHAGGEFLYRHLNAMSRDYEVRIIAPAYPENCVAFQKLPDFISACTLLSTARGKAIWKPIVSVDRVIRGIGYDPLFLRAFKKSDVATGDVRQAAVVDLQWTQSAVLTKVVRQLNGRASIILTVHDVLHQKWFREASRKSVPFFRRGYCLVRGMRTKAAEKRLFAGPDAVFGFSREDRLRIMRTCPSVNAIFLPPPLWDKDMPASEEEVVQLDEVRNFGRVLFVGAMSRRENDDAARWFVSEIWPKVLEEVPSAHLMVVGSNPSSSLLRAGSNTVTITGYVEDLSNAYKSSALFVAPLRSGAGVKFKVITAMLWGLPVVSTTVGSEGIGEERFYVGVSDDSGRLAEFVVAGLTDLDTRQRVSRAAFRWAHYQYSSDAYRAAVLRAIGKESDSPV